MENDKKIIAFLSAQIVELKAKQTVIFSVLALNSEFIKKYDSFVKDEKKMEEILKKQKEKFETEFKDCTK